MKDNPLTSLPPANAGERGSQAAHSFGSGAQAYGVAARAITVGRHNSIHEGQKSLLINKAQFDNGTRSNIKFGQHRRGAAQSALGMADYNNNP